ncbi:MAG TPA: YicC/YloC family endoribonuclease [Gammaproteobacteria bacterium]
MPHSMTGFASAEAICAPFRLAWELRSVNHRFLDVSVRLPDELRPLEPECRDVVSQSVRRGKVDCTLKISVAAESGGAYEIVPAALEELRGLEKQVLRVFPDARSLSVLEALRWPGVLKEPQLDFAVLAEPAKRSLREAAAALKAARAREGSRLAASLEERNEAIVSLLGAVRPCVESAEARYRQKLEERLARLDVQAQPERLEQELVLLAQRLDVTEEIDRLAGHVAEVRGVLARAEPIGRRLDFLIQEMNREANTLASKAQDEDLTRAAVELKVLIEQMREQVQNLE